MSHIDFTKAPNGATHYAVQSTGVITWLKAETDNPYFFSDGAGEMHSFLGWKPTATHKNCCLFGSGVVAPVAPVLPAKIPSAFSVPERATHYIDDPIEGRKFFLVKTATAPSGPVFAVWACGKHERWNFIESKQSQIVRLIADMKPIAELEHPWMLSDEVIAEMAEFMGMAKAKQIAINTGRLRFMCAGEPRQEQPELIPYTTTVKGDTLHAEFKIIPSHEDQRITSCQAFKLLTELCKTKQVE